MTTYDQYKPDDSMDVINHWYRHTIWGNRIYDDNTLFEVMSLQVFQAGLTWKMILNKRDGFRIAFSNWDINSVAQMTQDDIETLRNDPNIIRNRLKIQAVIENARTIQNLQKNHGSFCSWFYDAILGDTYPDLMKNLKSKFKFMGPEISRMWLMASGRISQSEGHKYRPL